MIIANCIRVTTEGMIGKSAREKYIGRLEKKRVYGLTDEPINGIIRSGKRYNSTADTGLPESRIFTRRKDHEQYFRYKIN